jgi:hypothetical protein
MGPLFVILIHFIILCPLSLALGLIGVILSIPFIDDEKRTRKMCLVFFTPAIGISCMYIGCGVAILLLSLVRHINIGTEEDWWKGYEIYLIGGFIFSLYFSIRSIISVWKKVLHHK